MTTAIIIDPAVKNRAGHRSTEGAGRCKSLREAGWLFRFWHTRNVALRGLTPPPTSEKSGSVHRTLQREFWDALANL